MLKLCHKSDLISEFCKKNIWTKIGLKQIQSIGLKLGEHYTPHHQIPSKKFSICVLLRIEKSEIIRVRGRSQTTLPRRGG